MRSKGGSMCGMFDRFPGVKRVAYSHSTLQSSDYFVLFGVRCLCLCVVISDLYC